MFNHTGFIEVIFKSRGVSPVIIVAQKMNAKYRGGALTSLIKSIEIRANAPQWFILQR
jgi:hypothetical protein